MYSRQVRRAAVAMLAEGRTLSEVSRVTSVSRSTLRSWLEQPDASHPVAECPRCHGAASVDGKAYAALLGYYLGDGCISAAARYFALRVSCDALLPGIVADVTTQLEAIRPGSRIFHVRAPGVVVVQAHWKHWPCLFPQHGPGRKHERPIVLEGWQQEIVDRHPGDFLRGLFHSDGCRVNNWATRTVAGQKKRYAYGRWMFVNRSDDIIDLCTAALDTAGIAWRRPRVNCIAVSRAADVNRLDRLIGPKH